MYDRGCGRRMCPGWPQPNLLRSEIPVRLDQFPSVLMPGRGQPYPWHLTSELKQGLMIIE